MKAIQLLVNSKLPEDLRDYERSMDKKSISALLADVARKYPERYEEIAKNISDVGRNASYLQGETLTLNDMRPVFDRQKLFDRMDQDVDAARKALDPEDFKKARAQIWSDYADEITNTTQRESLAQKSNLANTVISGARGNASQLRMMISTPALYTDSKEEVVPLFVRRSFGDGVRPAEYLASTYGARKSVLCLHHATLVRMADGSTKPIRDIVVGDIVVGSDTEGNGAPTTVTSVFRQGAKPVYKYTFTRANSKELIEVVCTDNHKFLQNDYKAYSTAYNKYRKGRVTNKPDASLLHTKAVYPIGEKRSRQSAVLSSGSFPAHAYNEPYALLIGLISGDGCFTKLDRALRLSCADESLMQDIQPYLSELGLSATDRRRSGSSDWTITTAAYKASLNTSICKGTQGFVPGKRLEFRQTLIDHGLHCYAHEKKLPQQAWSWDAESLRQFLAGIIATDGSIYFDTKTGAPRISIALTGEHLVRGLRDILQTRLGVFSSEITFRDTGGFGNSTSLRKHRLWEFAVGSWNSVERLLRFIGKIPGVKDARLKKALEYKPIDNNPYPKARLVKSEYVGTALCFDIEVDHPDHLFVLANAIVSSNSTKRATAKGGDLCLEENTMVRMADGSTKPIRDIVVGDIVAGASLAGDIFPTRVVNVFSQGAKPVVKVRLESGHSFTCTDTHKFMVRVHGCYGPMGVVPVGALPATAKIAIHTLEAGKTEYSSVLRIDDAGTAACFDIEVDHVDHLFVLANGVITSNSKQMVQTATPVIITTSDCGVRNGLDLDIEDSSIRGRVLAEDYGPIKAGTVLDRQAINELRNNQGLKKIIVRSALTCDAEEGVCAHCIGVNPKGQFPELGDTIGITAAQAMGEPIAQGALNCLVEGTEVLMSDYSIKKIEDISVNDTVMGADVNGNMFPTRVTAVWDQGMQPAQRRYYKMGQTQQLIVLDSTAAHPVLSNKKTYGKGGNGKNNNIAEKIVAGFPHKNLAAVMPAANNTPGGDSDPWASFLGVYLGDGVRWNNDFDAPPCLSCADLSEIEDLNSILNTLGVTLKKRKRSFDWAVVMTHDSLDTYRDTKGMVTAGVRSPVKQKLIEWGLNKKYAHQKDVPQVVWTWDAQSVASMLAGFIAADGSVFKNKDGHIGISFASNSYALLSSLKRLLQLKLCVYGSALTCTGKAGEGNRVHDMWAFAITRHDQVTKLAGHIAHLVPGVKGARLTEMLSNADYEIRNPDWFYRAKRVDTEELGNKQCYDITVEHEDSLFVLANSLIVSNTKHTGGASQGAKRVFSGFDVINRFVQAPEDFPDRAVVAKQDGMVSKVEEAPQGGHFVYVGQDKHYIPAGYPVIVKNGDKLEAGDQLSEGLVDAGDIVELRGIGEGRRYYADRLKQILDDSGMPADRRNTEILARAALNHIQMEDADDDAPFLPDDVISYQQMSRHYTPPEDTVRESTSKAVGKYLQQPVLHYTIGTRITPNVIKRMEEAGKKEVYTSASAPNFSPSMVRLRTASHANRDWMAGMHTSYLKKNLAESAIRGDDTNIQENIHFAPRLAIGEGFAKNIEETGKF